MGKIEDMRRQREQQFAENERRRSQAAKAAPAAPRVDAPAPSAVLPAAPAEVSSDAEPAQPTRPARGTRPAAAKKGVSSKTGDSVADQGKCPECGKLKPLQNGVMASHQKGFGKACAGSRKKPDA